MAGGGANRWANSGRWRPHTHAVHLPIGCHALTCPRMDLTQPPQAADPIPPGLAAVARSVERARLDRWALVLLALEIPHQQVADLEHGGAFLVVRTQDRARALAALQAEEAELVERSREAQAANVPMSTPRWAWWWAQALAAALLAVAVGLGMREDNLLRVAAGVMDARQVLESGQWYRLFTGVTLHAEAAHLASNLLLLMVVVPPVAARLGGGLATAALLLTGAAGNLATTWYHGAGFSNVGASGGLFGLLCMLALISARTRTSRIGANRWLLGAGAGLALLSMMGFGQSSDVMAHMGGFAAGIPLGLAWPLRRHDVPQRWWWPLQVLLTVASLALITVCWWLALGNLPR